MGGAAGRASGHGRSNRRAFLRRSAQAAGVVGLASAGVGLDAGTPVVAGPPAGGQDGDLILVGATVVDARRARVRADQTIVVRAGRIAAVGDRRDVAVRFGADVVDVRGRFVIPALVDSHIHTSLHDIDLPLCVANGVTAVREMWGFDYHFEWREEIAAGTRIGPRYAIASDLFDGDPPIFEQAIVVPTPDDGRAEVRRSVDEGRDFVKAYSRLDRPTHLAMLDEGRRLGIPVVGHMPDRTPLQEALWAGFRTVEHMFGLWYPTSARETELRRRLADFDPPEPIGVPWWKEIHDTEWIASETFSSSKAEAMFRLFRRHRAAHVPTMMVIAVLGSGEPPALDEGWLRYFPNWLVDTWAESIASFAEIWTPIEREQWRQLLMRNAELVKRERNAGVSILAGTDAGNPYCLPGFGMHVELELLVQAGFSPAQALWSATGEPDRVARWNGWPGADPADLVVLDANPLADIRNTRRVHGVLTGGRWIGPAERERILAEVEAAARRYEQMAAADRPRPRSCPCSTLATVPAGAR